MILLSNVFFSVFLFFTMCPSLPSIIIQLIAPANKLQFYHKERLFTPFCPISAGPLPLHPGLDRELTSFFALFDLDLLRDILYQFFSVADDTDKFV